jgi:hypothetical protein
MSERHTETIIDASGHFWDLAVEFSLRFGNWDLELPEGFANVHD